jgi:arginyl-tRNA synthetase
MKASIVSELFEKALVEIGLDEKFDFVFETPKNPEHGDLSTNIAMRLAKPLKKAPKAIAEEIISKVEGKSTYVEKFEIAGPGFINIKFKKEFYAEALKALVLKGDKIGESSIGAGKKANVEYVSVNPTGLLHLGHARNACVGDTVANLYEWIGYDVTREYYFNNAGNQMNNLAKSIYARYMQIFEDDAFPFPEDGYHGDYIRTIAKELLDAKGEALKDGSPESMLAIRKFGEQWCFVKIKATLERMSIKQDVFFNEDSLYNSGSIKELIDEFKSRDLAYEKDGALWLSFTKLGLSDDRVIVKSTGEPTYRLPDIAYHREKFRRGFDLILDVFGADHIATIPDVMAGVRSLGFDDSKIKPIIHQFVTLTENGEQVKMSKRTGKSYTLDDLLDEVGSDIVRFFLLMRGVTTHLEFDLNLAREQSDKNPVFYLQYAHARICSVIDNAIEAGAKLDDSADLNCLTHPKEIELIDCALKFEKTIINAAHKTEPQILADYLRALAAAFHGFYHDCRIIGVDENLQSSRLVLARLIKNILKNGLSIMGVQAPNRM